jgi:hypothetical protein
MFFPPSNHFVVSVTRCNGQRIFQLGSGNVELLRNPDATESILPEVLRANNLGCNGVYHVISNVMLPTSIIDLFDVQEPEEEDGEDDNSGGGGGDNPDMIEPDCTPNLGT